MKKYKIIIKSMMDGSNIQHTREYQNDKEAITKNKGQYGLEIWKKIL